MTIAENHNHDLEKVGQYGTYQWRLQEAIKREKSEPDSIQK